jgi:SpoVK/Ycf46/Vps4 family AAA+-type ATPase
MTFSPFDNYQHRIFLCHGNTRDKYMLTNGFQVNFDELLFLHLKERGYHPVLLYSHHGLYFYDDVSRDWVIPPPDAVPVTTHASQIKSTSRLALGPGGLSLRRKPPSATVPASENGATHSGRLLYPNLAKMSEIQGVLRRLMTEGKQGAVIFDGDHLPDFGVDGPATQQFRGILERDLRQLYVDNRLIVIFISGLTGEQLVEHLPRNKPVLNFLYQLDANGKPAGIASAIDLTSPGCDEVTALIDYYRLQKNLQVEWHNLQRHVTVLTGYLKSNAKGIKDLDFLLNNLCSSNSVKAVLTTEQVQKMTLQNLVVQSANERLLQMVGMDELKKEIKSNVDYFQRWQEAQRTRQSPTSATSLDRLYHPPRQGPDQFLHIALMGNPGTGKTTVAELIGEIYRDAGVLETGHTVKVTRTELVAGYVGQTAIKTREKIEQARGGVLFIDEAYSLAQNEQDPFGKEACTTLLEAMSDLKSELMVIVAGYPEEIKQLIDSNPGFESRFGAKLTLPDMLPEQLMAVFHQQCHQHSPPIDLAPNLTQALPDFFQELYNSREDDFANARTVIEHIFKPMVRKLFQDTTDDNNVPADLSHIPENYQKLFSDAQHQKAPAPLAELNELIGLSGVKQQIQALIAQLENDLARQQHGIVTEPLAPGHYLFAGNPGTGKTTVARLMARQFKQMGLLPKDKLTERSASDLIGQYVGSTENAVRELLNEALGGVLFIDEAHQLANDQGFGKNALAPFTAFMETHKHNICIIFAGYGDGLNLLLTIDPGFRRRFGRIQFDDFNAEELAATFFHFANKSGFQVSPDLQQSLQGLFTWMFEHKGEQFGNAGTAQQLLTMMKAKLAQRMQKLGANGETPTPEQRNTLLVSDIPPHNECRYLLGEH